MAHKHLHELLTEDQEPFHLKNYIADHRRQLKPTTAQTSLNLRKRKSLIQSSTARSFCINHVCLFSFHDSPDVRKSPFPDFSSPANKSPNNATVFLHIPSRTAAMLLDAAMRIQKQKKPSYKPKTDPPGFGLFGSLFKRLKDRRTRIKRREISLSSQPPSKNRKNDVAGNSSLIDNYKRFSSTDWSEKSSDLEPSCSSWSEKSSEDIEFVGENNGFSSIGECFCSIPSSPFRFSLEKSPSSGHRTPDFLSPATSPAHDIQKDKEEYDGEKIQESLLKEEEKEQCSPVSVLDPLFDDDEEDCDGSKDHDHDLECGYALVERAKHQLLQNLQRFEKLAKLDPIELEKHMSERCVEDKTGSGILGFGEVPTHMKRLLSDLIVEESRKGLEEEVTAKRVRSRMESWKMVESNTIDMMVELDFRKEKIEGWKRYDEEMIRETGRDIEVAIFGVLTEELAQELGAV